MLDIGYRLDIGWLELDISQMYMLLTSVRYLLEFQITFLNCYVMVAYLFFK